MSAALPPTSATGHHRPKAVSPAMANAAAASFAALTARLDYLSPQDADMVRKAYRFADEAHLGQMRKSGEPYITHPIAVAAQCAEWKLDAQALMAALLHDAIEDCGVTKPELIERFGAPVAELVDGLTKLDKLQFNTREENQAESFRKMLLAMARDVRVILVKLADRSHNMRTLHDMPRAKWGRIASETLDIYAPIAHRLGLNQTYRQLQELSFQYLRPWRYTALSKAVFKARGNRRDLVERIQKSLGEKLKTVRVTHRLTDSPACLVADENDPGANLQRILKMMGQNAPDFKPILEINPQHPMLKKMELLPNEGGHFDDYASILFDEALLAEGGQIDDPAGFVRRINRLMLG